MKAWLKSLGVIALFSYVVGCGADSEWNLSNEEAGTSEDALLGKRSCEANYTIDDVHFTGFLSLGDVKGFNRKSKCRDRAIAEGQSKVATLLWNAGHVELTGDPKSSPRLKDSAPFKCGDSVIMYADTRVERKVNSKDARFPVVIDCEKLGVAPGFEGTPDTDGPRSCGGEKFPAKFTQSNMLVVLDRSGSMTFDLMGRPNAGVTRWEIASSVVKTVTSAHYDKIHFGLSLFPKSMTRCEAGPAVLGIGNHTPESIAASIPEVSGQTSGPDAASTPIAAALNAAANDPELSNPAYANHVLLVTDGDEQCGGNPVEAVRTLFGKDIKTYVVGFAGAAYVNPQALNAMAVEGGTARSGPEAYYRADNEQALMDALEKIAKNVASCSFDLERTPPDKDKIFVYVNGQQVEQDTSHTRGWDYSNNDRRITLYGSTCDALTAAENGNVTLVYGCPDPVVGGDGGRFIDRGDGPSIN